MYDIIEIAFHERTCEGLAEDMSSKLQRLSTKVYGISAKR